MSFKQSPLAQEHAARRARQRVPPLLSERLMAHADGDDDTPPDLPALRAALRASVLDNLQALLNCTRLYSREELARWPHVYASALNFGLPPLAGKMQSDIVWRDIREAILCAITRFEPRIIASELNIVCLDDDAGLASHNLLSFTLSGRLRWSPSPMDFMFTSRVDLENGHFELADKG